MPIYLTKQSEFAANSPMSFIFNFCSRDKWPSINVKAQEDPKIYFQD